MLQDLRCGLQKTRSELQVKEAALKESEAVRQAVVLENNRSVALLKRSLQEKEQQLQVTLAVPRTFSLLLQIVDLTEKNLFTCRSTVKCWSRQEVQKQEMLCWKN